MSIIKLSIIIPIFNGIDTFKIIFPHLIKTLDRQDIQIIVVNNNSTDGLDLFLKTFKDDRVLVVNLCEKLRAGESLSIGIENAIGQWIYYFGDDDQVIFHSLNILMEMQTNDEFDIIIGESVRYIWPFEQKFELLYNSYNERIKAYSAHRLGEEYLNRLSINAGGSFLIRKNIYDEIKKRYGFYSTPQGVEFFILRAALHLANKVACVNLPLFIHGRSRNGWGVNLNIASRWNDKFEWKDSFQETTFWCNKLYTSISYDAATVVSKATGVNIDYQYWIRQYVNEILFTKNQNRLSVKPLKLIILFILHLRIHLSIYHQIYALLFIFFKTPIHFLRKIVINLSPGSGMRAGYVLKHIGSNNIQGINRISLMSFEDFNNKNFKDVM